MSPFDRRRYIILLDEVSDAKAWADPLVDELRDVIRWRFKVPFDKTADVRVVAEGSPVGRLRLMRRPDGRVAVTAAEGICGPFTAAFPDPLPVARAAAEKEPVPLRLTNRLRGALEATSDGVFVIVEWKGSYSRHG